jgi:hypothetical protein
VIVESQTFAIDIRDAMYNILQADNYFYPYKFSKTRMLPIQVDSIPFLGVYLADEIMIPDGDPNAGCIRFSHSARIGFSIIHADSDQVMLERGIDAAFLRVMSDLWTNANLSNVIARHNPEGVGMESVIRGSRRHIFGSTGSDNETPFGELQYEVTCFARSEWYPDITDTLNEIDVTTGIKLSDTQEERDQRQQVTIKMMFDALREARRS